MVIVFKKGDDFLPRLKEFLRRNRVNSGFFYGLGGFQKAEIAFYDLAKKKYLKKKFNGPFEVLSLTGNVAQSDDDIFIHCHVVLGDKNYKTFGGHLMGATVSGTLEVKLSETEFLQRSLDKNTGLNLLQ
jgi:predicted DNA-binding protein with PD1-like motif